MPPEWMWPFDDELLEWFEEVDAARKAKYANPGAASDDDDEDTGMMRNEMLSRR